MNMTLFIETIFFTIIIYNNNNNQIKSEYKRQKKGDFFQIYGQLLRQKLNLLLFPKKFVKRQLQCTEGFFCL